MRKIPWLTLVLLTILAPGCGRRLAPPPAEPLTVDAWRALPPETKFEAGTFERLKQGTPELQDDTAWDRFARTVVVPAQQKELPKRPSGT